MLGAETCGLPENLGRAVAEFFGANIAWIFKVLPSSMPAKKTRAKAIQTVATLQGAMMLAASISDLKTFEAAVTPFLQTCDID